MSQVTGKLRMFNPLFVPDEGSICIPYTTTVSAGGLLDPHFLVHLPNENHAGFRVVNATFKTSEDIDIRRDRMSHYAVFAHGTLFSWKARMKTTSLAPKMALPSVTDFLWDLCVDVSKW